MVMISCPYCGNTYSIISCTDGNYYCPTCHYYFKIITSTIADTATISSVPSNDANIPNTGGVDNRFYSVESKGSNFLEISEYDKLTINAKSIKIDDNKISITIDKDNIDKFNAIEINGIKFAREDN